jgi:hypothetical protein
MTKAEFIKRLEDQFQGMIESVKRRTAAEIEGSRSRMDTQAFADWIRSERDKANAEPALKAFDTVLKASHSTPHDAADSLAALIEMDTAPDDWQTQWDSAAPLISNFRPEKSDGWKYRRAFADYMAATKAEARARLLSDFVEKTNGKDAPAPKAEPKYELEALFIEGEKDYFLRAAIKAGIIDSAGKWILGDRKKWLIPATWYLAINRNMTAPGLDNFKACNAIAEHWGISISKTTVDDFWITREVHNSKRGFDSYSRFLQEFTRG